MSLHTPLCDLLGCRYPIVQTAMGWVADPRLVAATCNAGGFGFLAGAVMSPAEVDAAIAQTKVMTDRPFGFNFHMFQPGATDIVDLAIKNRDRIRAVSYGRGPDKAIIRRFRDAGIICMPTVGAVKHAIKAIELGADVVTVQGSEGGGHTGSVPTTILLPQVLDAVKVPVVAAGGFYDGRGLAAALAYGAAGIAMGTRFLMTKESPVPTATLQRYVEARDPAKIRASTALDGLPQRMIDNEFLLQLESAGGLRRMTMAMSNAWKWKAQNGLTTVDLVRTGLQALRSNEGDFAVTMMAANAPMIIQRAMVQGEPAEGVLPSGQVAAAIGRLDSCAEIIEAMARQAEERLGALCAKA
ncbi:MAG: nitronate monooxygenase [Rhodocyclales bacterium]|nr:nitronate monooxygenase [Rhodocyclales bacterium]